MSECPLTVGKSSPDTLADRRRANPAGIKRHVWTTPSKQGRSGMLRRGRVRSCVRPTLRGLRTAGPDAIRSLAPKQIYALEWRITLDGLFQAPGSTGSPSRHHRPHSPISCGNRRWVPSASGYATWDCCRHAVGFSTHEQSPYDPRRLVSLCHRDEPCGPAFEQAFEPASLGCGFASRMPDHRGCTQHEQSAQVAITLFGDPPWRCLPPLLCCLGTSPIQAARCRAEWN